MMWWVQLKQNTFLPVHEWEGAAKAEYFLPVYEGVVAAKAECSGGGEEG